MMVAEMRNAKGLAKNATSPCSIPAAITSTAFWRASLMAPAKSAFQMPISAGTIRPVAVAAARGTVCVDREPG
ncbi:unnamed protein product [Mesocestoides corti]|uniref:Uncharacterized protein n=1 Tax=Mesocestoides corti TaxID=53468 RepID=A0A0R3UBQ7_MESCO|nr:unnamed protein product [Mesocestoides corti]